MKLTDDHRWDYAWFTALPTEMKLLFVYVEDHTDLAAVWPVNKGLAEYHIGSRIDWGLATESFRGQIHVLTSGEQWFLPEVLARRHPAGLGSSKLHEAVRQRLTLHKIDRTRWPGGGQGDAIPMASTSSQQTTPPSSSDSSGGGAEGVPAKLTPATLRVWLETKNVGNDESAADEWAGFVRKRGIKTAAQAFACLDWCIRRARQSGRPVRYAKDVEDFGQQWRDMTKETERMSKESA